MIDETLSSQLTRSIESAQTIIILLDHNASFDQAASALALVQSLEQAGKEVRLVVPELLPGLDQLSETDRFQIELGHQSLTISFNYSEEKVDKISYHIGEETGKFYLTVRPQAGAEPLDPATIEYSHTGAEADLLILIGVTDLEQLDQLYFGYEELFRNTTSISLHNFETDFGTIKIDTSLNPTVSEFVFALLENQNLHISADAATNLLAGIEHATNRLQSRAATAGTFATVAKLLNLGARRILPIAEMPSRISAKGSAEESAEATTKMRTKAIANLSTEVPKMNGELDLKAKKVTNKKANNKSSKNFKSKKRASLK